MPRPRELPERARVVIVGGGVGGTSIAYHLAALGERDVVLLDRAELTSGSTFHSAGLVGQLRGSVSLTRMMMDSVELYRTLDCGWVECGGIRLACTPEREQEIHRQVAWARTFGLPLERLGPEEARARFPLMVTDGVRAASYLPTDGYLDPSQLTYALAKVARAKGTTGTRTPARRPSSAANIPPALTTTSASIGPQVVCTPRTRPSRTSMASTRVWVKIRAPPARAPSARA